MKRFITILSFLAGASPFMGDSHATTLPHTVMAQDAYPQDVMKALAQAGKNRASLEQALKSYRPGSMEYKAACFLIANMPYHSIGGRIQGLDRKLDTMIRTADQAYNQLIQGSTAEEQESDPLHARIQAAAEASAQANQQMAWTDPVITVADEPDIVALDGKFIRKQVEHCCKMRRASKRLMQMSDADFFDYILSYRSVSDYPLVTTADTLSDFFSKYLRADTATVAVPLAERYNRATWWLRHWGGDYPFDTSIGWREMFFSRDAHDCVDMAFYGAQILRACGWPATVEYNTAYKIWSGRHYDLAIPSSWNGEWQSFSPETEVPRPAEDRFKNCLNIYRMHFAPQDGTPIKLRAEGEPVPDELADPCIEDVSSHYTEVCHLSLPLSKDVSANRKLVYLASFQSHTGWVPVTWGTIDRKNGKMEFQHVVTDHLYLPMTYGTDGQLTAIGAAFRLKHTGKQNSLITPRSSAYEALHLNSNATKQVEVSVSRKFPRKPSMLACAHRAVGTVVLGDDNESFQHADTLGTILIAPEDEWADLSLKPHRPYRYYRVAAPAADPHVMLSEIQFLTSRTHNYTNVMQPTALDSTAKADSLWMRLMDEPLDKCQWKAEYDGDVKTAPDGWPDVTLKLAEPQKVERIRFMVKNAENHVKPGVLYTLRHWNGSTWEEVWTGHTRTNHLPALKLHVGDLYWLEYVINGAEELPFIVQEDGSVIFPHQWLLEEQ